MKSYHRLQGLLLAVALVSAGLLSVVQSSNAQSSTGIIVESVNNYGGGPNCSTPPNLCNSIANGDGFLQGMVFPGSRFFRSARWTDGSVYDTDFVDPEINAQGADQSNFDKPGTAVSYFTGHGITADGCSSQACTSTSQCTTPNAAAGQRFPASCRFSPFDSPRCCYMVDRAAVVKGSGDRFNGIVNYTRGPIRWGESPQAGGWAGAGTNGGANLVVLDISHGILPTFWVPTLLNANAGVQLIATLMTAGGDTANVSNRGSTLASFYRANERNRVSGSWQDTMNSLPANLGSRCPGGGGGHGFNGCGCHIIVGMDVTLARAEASMNEGWVNLINDNNDALGNRFFAARWLCNYPLPASDQSAWERP
jgi:hypothetical protein